MAALENRSEQVESQFETLVKWTSSNRARAEVILWELLWGLTDLATLESPVLTARPGPVETALGIIENELETGLNAKSLAVRVALSYSQLNHWVSRRRAGCFPVRIAAREGEQAAHAA